MDSDNARELVVFVEFATPERLMDGTLDPDGEIATEHYRIKASGLPSNAWLDAAILVGGVEQWSTSAQADSNGDISTTRALIDSNAVAVLNLFGGASWDMTGQSTMVVEAGAIAIHITVRD